MKPRWRTTILGIGVTAAAAAGLLAAHAFVTSRPPAAPVCAKEPSVALECYEHFYRTVVARQGVPAAFADLKARSPGDAEVQRLCHAITHAIGREAAAKYSDVAEAFVHGDNVCGSGYYHGVLQGFAFTLGHDKLVSELDEVCAGVSGKERRSLEYYNCVHGLGHGLMAVTGGDLFGALRDCDGLTGAMERDACANGVFMENVVVDGAHGGHYSKYLRPGEPLYPCTAVDGKYKAACFDIQTSYALGAVQGDFAKVFALCAGVEMPFRATCDRSLGRDAATTSLDQVPGTITRCNLGTGREQRSNCLVGAVLDFVYYYHSDTQAKELCAAAGADVRDACRAAAAKLVGLF